MNITSLFTTFSGRINRSPYWIGVLALAAATIVLAGLFFVAIFSSVTVLLIAAVLILLLTAASIPLTVKRLHDRGKSGHWAWLLYGSSIVGGFADPTRMGQMNTFGMIVSLITVAIGLWFFVELGFFRGTAGPNAYGPDPLEAK
jgi:uncharacterized membrane protein YhaH (DUF805 family)